MFRSNSSEKIESKAEFDDLHDFARFESGFAI